MSFVPVMKKELKSFFYSPIAYVVMTMFLLLSGYFCFTILTWFSNISGYSMQNPGANVNVTDMVVRPLYSNINFILLLIVPILTMKIFAEEKKLGTFELITTYPVKDFELVLGKLFACVAVLLVMLTLTLIYPAFLMYFSQPDTGVIATAYLGLLLMGISFISMGIFISSLTDSQIIAAIITFSVLLLFWMIGWVSGINPGVFSDILSQFSLLNHFENFAKGVIDLSDIVYYLCFIFFCIFLTLRSLESKKWRS